MQIADGNLLIPLRYLAIPCVLGGICSLGILLSLIHAGIRLIIYVFSRNKYHLAKAKERINAIKSLLLFELSSFLNEEDGDEHETITQIISVIFSASFWIFVVLITTELF